MAILVIGGVKKTGFRDFVLASQHFLTSPLAGPSGKNADVYLCVDLGSKKVVQQAMQRGKFGTLAPERIFSHKASTWSGLPADQRLACQQAPCTNSRL